MWRGIACPRFQRSTNSSEEAGPLSFRIIVRGICLPLATATELDSCICCAGVICLIKCLLALEFPNAWPRQRFKESHDPAHPPCASRAQNPAAGRMAHGGWDGRAVTSGGWGAVPAER